MRTVCLVQQRGKVRSPAIPGSPTSVTTVSNVTVVAIAATGHLIV